MDTTINSEPFKTSSYSVNNWENQYVTDHYRTLLYVNVIVEKIFLLLCRSYHCNFYMRSRSKISSITLYVHLFLLYFKTLYNFSVLISDIDIFAFDLNHHRI